MLCFQFHWLLTISALRPRQPHWGVHLHGDDVRDGGDDDGSVDGDLEHKRNKNVNYSPEPIESGVLKTFRGL